MKTTIRISTILLAAALMSFTSTQLTTSKSKFEFSRLAKTNIKWKNSEINLGEIVQNKPVSIEFEFMNAGENAIVISSVQASCGCTTTDFAKTPILPGESTKIKAVFNAAAKGVFKKQVTVITNTEETPKVLIFTGTVI